MLPDDEGDDGVAVPTWIMGIPYTGEANREAKTDGAQFIYFSALTEFNLNSPLTYSSISCVRVQREIDYRVVHYLYGQ